MKITKIILALVMIFSFSQAYAECNRVELITRTYTPKVSSADFNVSDNTITVKVAYNLASMGQHGWGSCGVSGDFRKWHSRHTVIIGGNESAPQYVTAPSAMPASLLFRVSVNGLDMSTLASGGYKITPSSYYNDGYTTAHRGDYNYFYPQSVPTSIIANMGPSYKMTVTENRTVECPPGQIGYVKQKRTYDEWTDNSIRNGSDWFDISINCAIIPSQDIEKKDGMEEVSCDAYYSAVTGSYAGSVYKYGEYLTSYNSATRETSTVLNVKSVDKTSCKAQTTDMAAEYKAEDCGVGETGSKKYLRYKAINSKSEVTYPYGDWVVFENTCIKQSDVENSKPIEPEKVTGLLSNMSFTSSRLISDDTFSTYLNSLAVDGWTGKERHKLTISIDDLSNGSYDPKKISAVINKFKSVVGASNTDVKIVLPRSIDKLIGNGNITSKSTAKKAFVLKSIRLVGTNAVVNYAELVPAGKNETKMAKEIKIPVFTSSVDLTKISSE